MKLRTSPLKFIPKVPHLFLVAIFWELHEHSGVAARDAAVLHSAVASAYNELDSPQLQRAHPAIAAQSQAGRVSWPCVTGGGCERR